MTGLLLGDLMQFCPRPGRPISSDTTLCSSITQERGIGAELSDGQSHEEACMYDALSRSLPKQLGIHTSPPVDTSTLRSGYSTFVSMCRML